MAAVIDASFAATLFLPDESSARSSEHFASAASTGIIAPALWQVEVTNIVVMAHRRKRISTALVGQIFDIIDRLPVVLESALTLDQRRTTANIAVAHGLTAYDAVYLELAMRRGFDLMTLDSALTKAARAVGVHVVA